MGADDFEAVTAVTSVDVGLFHCESVEGKDNADAAAVVVV